MGTPCWPFFVHVGGVWAVGLILLYPVPLFGRLRGANYPVWSVGVGRWSVGRVPVPCVGGLPLAGATGLAVGLFLFSHIQFVFVGGGGTIPNVGRWPVCLFQLPVGWVGLFLFPCWPSEVGGGWFAVWRVPVPCVGQTGGRGGLLYPRAPVGRLWAFYLTLASIFSTIWAGSVSNVSL